MNIVRGRKTHSLLKYIKQRQNLYYTKFGSCMRMTHCTGDSRWSRYHGTATHKTSRLEIFNLMRCHAASLVWNRTEKEEDVEASDNAVVEAFEMITLRMYRSRPTGRYLMYSGMARGEEWEHFKWLTNKHAAFYLSRYYSLLFFATLRARNSKINNVGATRSTKIKHFFCVLAHGRATLHAVAVPIAVAQKLVIRV